MDACGCILTMTPYLLNLCDLFLTLYALSNGGVELNPLLKSVPVMVAWKVGGVGAFCAALERIAANGFPHQCAHRFGMTKGGNDRKRRLARFGLNLCTVVYGAVCIYHLIFIFGGA